MTDRLQLFDRHPRAPTHGRTALVRQAASAALLALLLAACGGSEPAEEEPDPGPISGVEIVNLTRTWWFAHRANNAMRYTDTPGSPHHRAGFGNINDPPYKFAYAPGGFLPPGRGPDSEGEVYSTYDGTVYGVRLDSPWPSADNNYAIETRAIYEQRQHYQKVSAAARLRLKVSAVVIEAASGNTRYSTGCEPANAANCSGNLVGKVEYLVDLRRVSDGSFLANWRGYAELAGLQDAWEYRGTEYGPDAQPDKGFFNAWEGTDLVKEYWRENGTGTHHARLTLRSPVSLDVPLDQIPKGEKFYIEARVVANAYNGMQGESGITVWLQDPVTGQAMESTVEGADPIPLPEPEPASAPNPPLAICSGPPDPAAGVFEFTTAAVTADEGQRLKVWVRRGGGSKGAASVRISTRDADATGGIDYEALSQTLEFADGHEGDEAVELWIPRDGMLEPDERFELELSDVRACAGLGAMATGTVTISDYDTRHQSYTLGGSVSGLVGSGLFVRSNGFDVRVDASGPFTLPGTFAPGTVYSLDVEVQPSNPLQTCRVTNGQGTVGNANVTDLAVVCDPPAPPPAGGGLDTSFGGGKVANRSYGRILSMGLQPDGRIVVLTDFNKLLRYQVDGTLDTSFGSNGVVSATLGGNALDLLRAVALQADGGILVAGLTRAASGSTTAEDMGVKRYLANGTVDTSFGSAGFVRVDIAGRADDATAIAVQPDGKIVLGGMALVTVVGASDLALARLDANGALDAGFGAGGKLTVNIGGNFDSASAMALQGDGAIVLVGRAATSPSATPDTGVLRVSASGVVELALRLPLTADWDEATGVAVQPDGRMVLTLEARADAAGLYQHALARLKPDGTLDETFGTLGVALAAFSVGGDHARVPVLLSDGRILTAGFARGTTLQISDFDDFLVTRHLADGVLDTSFGSSGRLIVDFFGASDGARAMLQQPDGRAVVGGLARSGTDNGLGLLRVLP
ncbi:Calx-beta domain-containing protein [Variovorax sp. YR752]|uniref:Calx-beta domain-containing protein n=1 Tax=Variovorax sp. YR752 TaxID=1884383 RepID=UPI003138392E